MDVYIIHSFFSRAKFDQILKESREDYFAQLSGARVIEVLSLYLHGTRMAT